MENIIHVKFGIPLVDEFSLRKSQKGLEWGFFSKTPSNYFLEFYECQWNKTIRWQFSKRSECLETSKKIHFCIENHISENRWASNDPDPQFLHFCLGRENYIECSIAVRPRKEGSECILHENRVLCTNSPKSYIDKIGLLRSLTQLGHVLTVAFTASFENISSLVKKWENKRIASSFYCILQRGIEKVFGQYIERASKPSIFKSIKR